MPDWRSSMQQTFEYYTVDPGTWKDVRRLDNVKSCTINRDSTVETLGSATFDITDTLGESYIRVYLVTVQNGIRERFPLGTFLTQTPSSTFDGRIRSVSVDAYTPLLELKENPPPIGYSILKDTNIMEIAGRLADENMRAPVIKTSIDEILCYDFVANTNDTWLKFISDLISNAKHEFGLDELGRVLFFPKQDVASMQPVWTFDDGNSSILYPSLSLDNDIYGIPNVVEIVYTRGFYDDDGKTRLYSFRLVNDDPNSPISTVSRGREILHRAIDPTIASTTGSVTKNVVANYAETLLRTLSSVECKVSYTHGYCPVRVGDCIRLDHPRADLSGVRAKIISQSIQCVPGCPVSEKAVFTNKLWG